MKIPKIIYIVKEELIKVYSNGVAYSVCVTDYNNMDSDTPYILKSKYDELEREVARFREELASLKNKDIDFKKKARADARTIEILTIPCAGCQDTTYKAMMDMVNYVLVLTNDI